MASGPPSCPSGLEDIRGPCILEGLGFWHLWHWSVSGTPSLPFLFLAIPCLLCPMPLAQQAVGSDPEVLLVGSGGWSWHSVCVLVAPWVCVCARACLAVLGGLGTWRYLKATLWEQRRLGRGQGSTGRWQVCSPKPHHRNRHSSVLMPSLGTETMLDPPAHLVQS